MKRKSHLAHGQSRKKRQNSAKHIGQTHKDGEDAAAVLPGTEDESTVDEHVTPTVGSLGTTETLSSPVIEDNVTSTESLGEHEGSRCP